MDVSVRQAKEVRGDRLAVGQIASFNTDAPYVQETDVYMVVRHKGESDNFLIRLFDGVGEALDPNRLYLVHNLEGIYLKP